MKKTAIVLLGIALASAGCAPAPRLRLARQEAEACKHCNCTMPAGIPRETRCPVCNCGYAADRCYRR